MVQPLGQIETIDSTVLHVHFLWLCGYSSVNRIHGKSMIFHPCCQLKSGFTKMDSDFDLDTDDGYLSQGKFLVVLTTFNPAL